MADMAASSAVATKCTDILIDKVMKELPYLCCYKSYAVDFERKKQGLSAAVESVEMKIKEAKTRNETQIDPIVKHWVQKANNLIQLETTPKKWFGFCTDWFSQCSLAKELESMTQEIPKIMEKAENFSHVAHAAESPGMEFYSQEFMHFKSRHSVFEQLMEELKDGNKYRIGLQAMGGSGKTTMAKAVGKELENSKAFDKVIFIEVPNPVDEKKIRDEIEKKLDLKIDDDKKENLTHAEQIWIRIANAGKVLIILDDVWNELNLENIGIHHGIHTEGRCCVLLTTRYETVCTGMRCQKTINLEVLPEEDAVDLFLYHASETVNDCTYKLKLLASKIVNECGKLPVIIVAVAKTFRNWAPNEWEDAFVATENDSSLRHGNTDEGAKKFYNSLKRSFECLDTGGHDLILLCSIFPRAYEIPVELLSRIAIGLGLCGNIDSYYKARSQVLSCKTKLVSSALLLPSGEGCVKMHDVIRDVAQKIADEKIQVIMDSKTKLKENVKYSSWMIDDFSNYFEGNNLEVLLVWVNANASLEVHNAFFRGMKGLRVLLLCSKFKFGRTLALSLPKSIHSLENIRTLSLTNWELGDISILQNLKELQSLELTNCSILALPDDVSQLKKLRLLRLARCSIKMNNPLEVIGRCSKLEVLYYISNNYTVNIDTKPSKITDLQKFVIYHIEGSSSVRYFQLDASTKRYFNSTKLKGILSESTIKSLAARAEILELTECIKTRWTNLIPDMVHAKEDGGMNDLIRLSLKSWPAMQCLIYTNGIPSDVAIFSNLVELRLHDMLVRELCRGDFPIDFLKQLEKLNLSDCDELVGTLFKGKLELSNLKHVELMNCSMTCLFHLSTAQSLRQLENLCIRGCSKLKCLISDDERAEQKVDDHQDPNQKNHHSMFLKLKFVKVQECQELDFILPIFPCKELESVEVDGCNELKYIFGQSLKEGGQYQMENEIILPLLQKIKIANVPKFINIHPEFHPPQPSQVQKSWGPMCCFSSKASSLNIDERSFSKANQPDHTQASKEKHLSRVGGLFTPPLYPFKNLREMSIEGFSELKSLLTLSIASSLKLMETLNVNECGALEHIITDERPNSHGHMNVHSIFPNLQQVYVRSCNNLEYVFPAFYSRDFKHLENVSIRKADKMKYVFGKCHTDQNYIVQSELALQALKELCLDDVPNMVSICTKNYSVKSLSLQDIRLEKCPQLPINSVMDLCVDVHKGEEDLSKRKEKGKKEFTCLYVAKGSKAKSDPSATYEYFPPPLYQFNLRKIKLSGFSQLTSLFTISVASSLKLLETLEVEECDALQHIITDEGPNSHDQTIVHSFFPSLQEFYIRSCNNLEYVFPAFYSKDFKDLEVISIREAKRIKYVFGKCRADQDHNVQSKLNFPALTNLYLSDVESLVSICTENYYVEVLHLEDITCEGCQQLPQTFIDFLFGGHKRQDLSRRKALSFKERGKPLSNLQELCDSGDIYVEPKNFLSFQNLSWLRFVGCKQLKFILSASNTRSIPELRYLFISDCEELVSIFEDDEQNQKTPLGLQQGCFPELRRIIAKQCKKLKCLFSISICPKLPRLQILEIEDAPELEQVFEWKQGAPQELVISDVFPDLLGIRLVNLPSLHTIYQGIDFQTLKVHLVRDCGNIPSANASSSELFDFLASLRPDGMNFVGIDYYLTRDMISRWAHERQREEESEKALERDKTISEQSNSTLNLEDSEEASKETDEKDCTIQKQGSSSPNLTESINASANEAVEEKLSTTLSSNSNVNTEASKNEIVEEELPTLNAAATPYSKSNRDNLVHKESSSTHFELTISNLGTTASTKELCGKESKCEQETLGEGISLNQGHQRVKEPTNDFFTKETTKKIALDPSIFTLKKPSIAISTTHTEPKSSQSDMFDTSINTECPQSEEIPNKIAEEDCTINNNLPNLIENTNAPANGIVEEKLPATPSSDLDMEVRADKLAKVDKNLEETFGEGPSPEKYDKASSSTYSKPKIEKLCALIPSKKLCGKDSMGDQQALEEPTNECSSKETSNEMAITRTSPPIFLISSPKKPQIETSAAQVESGNSTITDQFAQDNLVLKASSTTPSKLTISSWGTSNSTEELSEKESKGDQGALAESTSCNEGPQRVKEPTIDHFTKETINKVSLEISTTNTEMASRLDPSISTPKKSPVATSTTPTEPKSSQLDLLDISIPTECPQVELMTSDETCTDEEEMKFDQKSSSQIFEEHDLMRLFQMMKEGSDMEVDFSYVSNFIADLQDNKEVSNALADLEASLKKGLKEIACSEESRLSLQNVLNTLSSHCSEDGASSHGLQDTIQSLQQEIQTVLSSFNQAYATIDTFTKLEQTEKFMIEQRSQREKDAKTLIYDINNTKNSIAEAQLNEAELKEQISKLQADLRRKQKEMEEYERKLLSLQEQEKKSVSDTIGFTMEFLAVEKERSRMVEDQMKAKQQLENVDAKWSSCLSNLKKATMLLGVHLKQKL